MQGIKLPRPVLSATLQPLTFLRVESDRGKLLAYEAPREYWPVLFTGYTRQVIIETAELLYIGTIPTQAPGETVTIRTNQGETLKVNIADIENVCFGRALFRGGVC